MNVRVLLGVVAGLLVGVIVGLVVVVNIMIRNEEQRSYENCMARAGYAADQAPVYDDADAYLDGAIAAAERCDR